MSPQETTPFDGSSLLSTALNAAMKATLHRLRGVRGLILGWAMVGVPHGEEAKLQSRLDEDLSLLGRLDWLRAVLYQTPAISRLERGEAPDVLLAAALRYGTPEEAGDRLPDILLPQAAIAISIYFANLSEENSPFELGWSEGSLSLTFPHFCSPSLEWQNCFGSLLLPEKHENTLSFRADCFRPAGANLPRSQVQAQPLASVEQTAEQS